MVPSELDSASGLFSDRSEFAFLDIRGKLGLDEGCASFLDPALNFIKVPYNAAWRQIESIRKAPRLFESVNCRVGKRDETE